MNKQEFKESMILLRKQVEMLAHELDMDTEFSAVSITSPHRYNITCAYNIYLRYEGYNTTDVFNNTMIFCTADINKLAVSIISSFFRDYVQALSLKVNKQ